MESEAAVRTPDAMRHGRAAAATLLHELRRINDGTLTDSRAVHRTEEALAGWLSRYAEATPQQQREFVSVLSDFLARTMTGIAVDPEFYVPPDINEAITLFEAQPR